MPLPVVGGPSESVIFSLKSHPMGPLGTRSDWGVSFCLSILHRAVRTEGQGCSGSVDLIRHSCQALRALLGQQVQASDPHQATSQPTVPHGLRDFQPPVADKSWGRVAPVSSWFVRMRVSASSHGRPLSSTPVLMLGAASIISPGTTPDRVPLFTVFI